MMLENTGNNGIIMLVFILCHLWLLPHEYSLCGWGDQGFAELTGVLNPEDIIEFTNWSRVEHCMRGLYKEDLYDMGSLIPIYGCLIIRHLSKLLILI